MRIVVVSGKAGSGKDTSAVIMADILRKAGKRVLITHYADLLKYICRQFFGWNGHKDEDGRHLLQYVGTDVIRKVDPDFWVGFLRDVLFFFEDKWDYVLIPDLRFPNELSVLRDAGFETIHVRVLRDGADNGLTEKQKEHLSETALDNCLPDLTLRNDEDIPALQTKIAALIEGGIL